MSNGSSETRAKAFSLKSALEKSGVTYTVCLMASAIFVIYRTISA